MSYTWGYGLSGSAASHARLEKITLPGGRQVYYNYEDANQFMSLGRVGDIADGNSGGRTKYVAYKYLGASMVVDANHPAVPTGLRLTYAGSTSGDYSGLDPTSRWGRYARASRFARVVWQTWKRTSGSTAADRYFYGYDRSGNRKWRAERSNVSTGGGRDEAYVYDKLDRLIGAKRGILPDKPYQAPYPGDATLDGVVDGFDYTVLLLNWLGSGKTWTQADFNGDSKVDFDDNTILSLNWLADPNETVARSWSWSLTATGNWSSSMINDANQTRTHDKANQITSISGISLAPLYDQAGNNVRGPRPADPNANNAAHFRYDAWNRLSTIHLDNGSASGTLDANDTLLATYRYDGLNRRVKKVSAVDGNSVTDYMFFNEGHGLRSLGEAGWQIVEVRRGVNQTPTAAAYKQFVYDIRYIDAPVCRWWDKDSDGTMEPAAGEMQYFTNDGNFNTTALVDANSGSVVERYLYDPYGKVTFLDANWAPRSSSSYDNEVLYCGYWYDPETGLFHVRERYYDPLTGTWKTRDRILYPDGANLYEYVRSSPTQYTDSLGQEVDPVADTSTARVKLPPRPTDSAPDMPPWGTVDAHTREDIATARMKALNALPAWKIAVNKLQDAALLEELNDGRRAKADAILDTRPGLRIVFGALHSGRTTDPVELEMVANKANYTFMSQSASQFYEGIKKLRTACENKYATKADRDCNCCIRKLVRHGHSSQALGGKESLSDLSSLKVKNLKEWMCPSAQVVDLGCHAFRIYDENRAMVEENGIGLRLPYKNHLELAMLVAEKGGIYEGYRSATVGVYPNVSSSPDFAKGNPTTTRMIIAKSATEEQVRNQMYLIDPTQKYGGE